MIKNNKTKILGLILLSYCFSTQPMENSQPKKQGWSEWLWGKKQETKKVQQSIVVPPKSNYLQLLPMEAHKQLLNIIADDKDKDLRAQAFKNYVEVSGIEEKGFPNCREACENTKQLVHQAFAAYNLNPEGFHILAYLNEILTGIGAVAGGETDNKTFIVLREVAADDILSKMLLKFTVYHEIGHIYDQTRRKKDLIKLISYFLSYGILPLLSLKVGSELSFLNKFFYKTLSLGLTNSNISISIPYGLVITSIGIRIGTGIMAPRICNYIAEKYSRNRELITDQLAVNKLLEKNDIGPILCQLFDLKRSELKNVKFGVDHSDPAIEYQNIANLLEKKGYTIEINKEPNFDMLTTKVTLKLKNNIYQNTCSAVCSGLFL